MNKVFRFLRKRWWIIIVITVLLAAAYPLILGKRQGNYTKPYTVTRTNLTETLTISGSVDAGEKADLQFQTGGLVTWVGVKEGDIVKKGQRIASIDQRQLAKTLEKDLNLYVKQRLDFDNQKQEYTEKALPGDKYLRQDLIDAFQKAQYDLNNTVLDVELQNISLQYSTLVSPIDGIVTHVPVTQSGTNILPTQAGFQIVNPQTVFFSADADQTEIVQVYKNEPASILFDAFPDKEVYGIIESLGYMPKEGEASTVYEVKIKFFDSDADILDKYRIGMTGDVTFKTKQHSNVIAVPLTYINTEGDKKFLYKSVKGKPVKTYVEVGEAIETDTIVTSGLQEGDVIYDTAQ